MVKERWWGKKISANHPSQPQGFGIGEMLTGGTSEGEATPEEGSKSENSSTSGSTSKEPWTLVQKKKQGSQLKPAENTEERERTNLPAKGGATRDKAVIKIRTDLPARGGGYQRQGRDQNQNRPSRRGGGLPETRP